MNCHEIHPLLHAYMDSELDLMRSLEVERHLKTCASCMAIKRSLQSLHSTLRHSDLSYQAPDALRARILKSVNAAPEERKTRLVITGRVACGQAWKGEAGRLTCRLTGERTRWTIHRRAGRDKISAVAKAGMNCGDRI